ncbi:tRNA (adenine(58)-N(1))-methyltransferase, mitochondrial isoform 2-T2 [Polymixia lowei]
MFLQIPVGGGLLIHRLVRICTSGFGHQIYREMHTIVKVPKRLKDVRTYSVGTEKGNGNEGEGDNSDQSPLNPNSAPRLLFGRRRPLSPLERISSLLPQDSLSPEVLQLREQNQEKPNNGVNVQKDHSSLNESDTHSCNAQTESAHPETHMGDDPLPKEDISDAHGAFDTAVRPNGSETQGYGTFPYKGDNIPTALPGESLLMFGELLIAEYRKKGRVEFRKMFKLQEGVRLQSSWGTIGHDDIAGGPSGRILTTTHGIPILIRRPSLEDYVLYMKRGPAIAYPKDASTMLMMMDVTEGDCVLESGSGSGAMSLFLSRAVGSKGSVLSVEVREDHHSRAVQNYKRWRASWSLRRGEEWPDNVQFHKADLRTASSLLTGWGFHSVALDLISPQLVLPTVIPHLHPGAVCAVYLANITQVIDLLEGLRCSALPLQCERIIEVPLRDWLVAPAIQKDGRFCVRKAPILDGNQREDNEKSYEESTTKEPPPFGGVPYIARPHPEQMSHTAFLVKLRKCVR